MTLNAQRDIVIGALCSDAEFRDAIFKCKDVNAVAKKIQKYGADNGVGFDDIADVAKPLWGLVTNREREAFFRPCPEPFCKIWPCRGRKLPAR
jgi:hypothetical protein